MLFSIAFVFLMKQSEGGYRYKYFTPLEGFGMFMVFLVMFRVIFSGLYLLKWNLRLCCCKDYQSSDHYYTDPERDV